MAGYGGTWREVCIRKSYHDAVSQDECSGREEKPECKEEAGRTETVHMCREMCQLSIQ